MAKTTAGRQTSNKAGVASMGKKMDNSRHGFGASPSSKRVGGAFGAEDGSSPMKRKPGTAATRPGKASALRRVKSR
ncbi:MAG TPA: hypothetical protein VK595_03600 [Vicinamibacterales bacterium]|jgi:hypothetical protein|nr:hypothetical protein [Vicinamibacterales bacterium]